MCEGVKEGNKTTNLSQDTRKKKRRKKRERMKVWLCEETKKNEREGKKVTVLV